MSALETTGSGLITALEQTWADIRRRTPELPEVVVVTGTGLSSSAVHIDAKWGHFGADHWVEGRPTEQGQGAALDLSAGRRRPELFVAGEPDGQRPHPVIGFSDVQLTEQTLADYADTLAYLGAAIRLYRDTFRRLGLLGGHGEGQDGDSQQPTGKAGERFKVACDCQPPRSFWIRAKQYTPGPITCGVCGQDFQPQNANHQPQAG